MKACSTLIPWLLLIPVPAFAVSSTVQSVRQAFVEPSRDYSTGPLWVWNDLLTEDQIRSTLKDLARQNVKQVWVHPRPGLMTPYLEADWFRLWKLSLREAARLDMNVWIYDENSYPSGFAGGLVPEAMPESRGRGLVLREAKAPPKWSSEMVAVYRLTDAGFEVVTGRARAGEALPEGRYLEAKETRAGNSPWHGNRCYVNLLSPGVTEKFLELTLEPYRRELGEHFGQRIPGVFTDEPNIRPAGGFPWSEILAAEFKKRWGYDLLDHLPSLTQPVGNWRKIRHNYFQVLHEQFVERWAKPYYDYCEKNHLQFTGHYWDHEWPNCVGVPDNMAMYAWHQTPSIDCLMNQYAEHTHAQFGNVRMVRELSSVANQLGRKRTLCEIYGAGGWDLRFEDMKRIGDWLEVLGVNTLNEHLSYVTLRGARKRDHPQSFSYHEPWWEAYHINANYFTRLSAALSQGAQINKVLVLQPTTTAWMYQGDKARLGQIGDSFFKLLMALESAQIEYDLACEDIMAHHGVPGGQSVMVSGKQRATSLKIGQREYHTIIIPPFTETLNGETRDLLEQTTITKVVPGAFPARINGDDGSAQGDTKLFSDSWLTNQPAWLEFIVCELSKRQKPDGFAIERTPGDKGVLFHHRRQLADGELVFLVNTSAEHPSSGIVFSTRHGAESWNLYTGAMEPYLVANSAAGLAAKFDLPPSGSLLLLLTPEAKPARTTAQVVSTVPSQGEMEIKRLQPNVLTLDYVDVTAGGESRTNLYYYQANQFTWRKNGMDRNPWDSAVQFKSELISKKFPTNSGFEAAYRFEVRGAVPHNLALVLERPDLYAITVNGKTLKNRTREWWLDKSFGRLKIASLARPGTNTITIRAQPFTMFHELEPAYLLGDFALENGPRGFVIAGDRPLTLGRMSPGKPQEGWNTQGHPFYAWDVAYRRSFSVDKPSGRYRVGLPSWQGSVARVTVNGKPAGYITAPPYECDVTRQIKQGVNRVEVAVIGTLKNTLGPHHGNPSLGAAWPNQFQRGPETGPPPGDRYHTVGYGLFEPFLLKQSVQARTTEARSTAQR